MHPYLETVLALLNRLATALGRAARTGWVIGRFWMHRHPRAVRVTLITSVIVVALPVMLLFALPYLMWPFASRLDASQDLYTANRPLAFIFLDARGEVAGRSGARVGERLKLEDMPAFLPAAFIAMEDRRYYDHIGIDAQGLLQALIQDLRAGHLVAGGSTISQQTAKIVFTNSERSLSRKLSDMLGAESLEKTYSKKQILELYLNRIYLGSGAYGVDGAAHVYFGKSAKQVTLPEAAMLAALTTAPSAFSPRRDLKRARKRAAIVLNVMVDQGIITAEQADAAMAHPATISDRTEINARGYYLDAAAEEALRRIAADGGKAGGDLTVRTMLDPAIQEAARRTVSSVINGPQGRKVNASESAALVMKPDGGIVALIGGVDYAESSFNRGIQAHRQPGSAFKPFVYLAALEAGMTPWDVRDDAVGSIGNWTPTNFGGHSYGTVTLNDALTHSINTVAARLAQEVGIDAVIEAAKRCGIASKLEPLPSLALGTAEVTPLELTTAYATIASGGLRARPYFVTEIVDGGGKVLYRRKAVTPERVIASHVARDLTAMLYSVVTSGTGGRAGLWTHETAGKTGTTQDYHDAWFVGFTADYVASVWVGNDDATPMKGVTGGSLPAQMWRDIMKTAEHPLPARPLDRSPPYMPIDEDLMATGLPPIDDEAMGAGVSPPPPPQAPTPPAQKPKPRRGLLDWLLGGDEEKPDSHGEDSGGGG